MLKKMLPEQGEAVPVQNIYTYLVHPGGERQPFSR
jgi:hypothetical protein